MAKFLLALILTLIFAFKCEGKSLHPKDAKFPIRSPIVSLEGPNLSFLVGSQKQILSVYIESTHNQLWFMDPVYPGIQKNQQPLYYNASASTTSINTTQTAISKSGEMKYGGLQYGDNIQIDEAFGDGNLNWLQLFQTMQNSTIGNITNPPLLFGVIGLGWKASESRTSFNTYTSPILRLLQNYDKKMFAVWQSRTVTHPGQVIQASSIKWGGSIPPECDSSDLFYVPLKQYSNYIALYFHLDAIQIGKYANKINANAYADHGLQSIYVPDRIFQVIAKELNPEFNDEIGAYLVDCDKSNTASDWVFTIGGKDRVLKGKDFVVDVFAPVENKCVLTLDYAKNLVTPTDFAFGTSFLCAYCVVGDIDTNQIGFAKALK